MQRLKNEEFNIDKSEMSCDNENTDDELVLVARIRKEHMLFVAKQVQK